MVNNQSSHSWLGRFCARLMWLQPGLNVIVAVRHAVAAQPYASELEPEKAAEIFAETHPGLAEFSYQTTRRGH